MTEQDIIAALWANLYDRTRLCLPHFTPPNWSECDLWVVERDMSTTEYEVKTSATDFRTDVGKYVRGVQKHRLLELGSVEAPNQFYFVMPALLAADLYTEVPRWAGLIGLNEDGSDALRITPDPETCFIHDDRLSDEAYEAAKRTLYGRYWRAWREQRKEGR